MERKFYTLRKSFTYFKEEMVMKKTIFTICAILIVAGFAYSQTENIVVPYILKAPSPVTVDGVLDEWSFAFPLDHNAYTVPDSGRFRVDANWVVQDPEDCSGTLYMMYDEEYFYFAGSVRDDEPGHFSDAVWAADAIEFYMCNYDVGDVLFPPTHPGGGFPNDPVTGDYGLQMTIAFDESQDTMFVNEYYGVGSLIESENTEFTYLIWEDGDGYNLEGKIYLPDLDSPTTGNIFEFTPGTRIPMTWSLYDIDETESSGDFMGFAYTPKGYAGWMGVGPGWQVADVLEVPRGMEWEDNATFDFVSPYIKKVADNRPVEIDGDLGDWNFCFPLAHNQDVVPDSGRFRVDANWVPEDPEDLSGTIYQMYDDEYWYFAASVRDDEPGHFSDAVWAADAIEFYMANYDIGDAMHPEAHAGGAFPDDAATGDYGLQFTIAFDESQDSMFVLSHYNFSSIVESENTEFTYVIWEDGDGYNMEGKVYLPDIDSPATGNIWEFVEGYRLPFTWSLYDIDETESSGDFMGMAYTPHGYAGWMGVGPGWQYCDVKGISVIEYIDVIGGNVSVSDKGQVTSAAKSFQLNQNYPNPFNPSTTISFSMDTSDKVSLKIYNINGQLVKTVIDNERRVAGNYDINVDMSDVTSGVYLSVLERGNERLQSKMTLLK